MNLPERKKNQDNNQRIKEFSFDSNYNIVKITVLLFFAGLLCTVIYGFKTIIDILSLSKILAFSLVLSFFIIQIWKRSIFLMKKMEYLALALFGFAPILMGTFLILNFYIHEQQITQTVKVEHVMYDGDYIYYKTSNLPCDDYPELCVVHRNEIDLRRNQLVEITIAKGIGGFYIIKEIKAASN